MLYVTAYGLDNLDKEILNHIKENKVADAIQQLKIHYIKYVGTKGIINLIKRYSRSKTYTSTLGNLFLQDLVNYLTTDYTTSFSKYHVADGGIMDKPLNITISSTLVNRSSVDDMYDILNKGSLEELFFISELIKKYLTRG